jgi:ribosome biogenesis protein Tsr3
MSRSMMHFAVFLMFAFAATLYVLNRADRAVDEINQFETNRSFMPARYELENESGLNASIAATSSTRKSPND